MNRIKIVLTATLLILCSVVSVFAVTISTNLPDEPQNDTNPGNFVNYLYTFALTISGVLAFGAIVYGGIKYILATGNPSGQSEGKEWVKGALIGLLLLAGAYTILNIINPNITTLAIPELSTVTISNNSGTAGGECGPGSSCPAGYSCENGFCVNATSYGCITTANDANTGHPFQLYTCAAQGATNCSGVAACAGLSCITIPSGGPDGTCCGQKQSSGNGC